MTAEIITQYYAAFNAGDWPAMLALLADDVAHDRNQGGRELGRPAFAAFLARMQRSYRERIDDLVVLVAAGHADRAAAEWTVHGEYLVADDDQPPARGQRYVLPGGAFFALRDRRITRVTTYYNLEAWRDQVR